MAKTFESISSKNTLNHGLTELNVFDSIERGFMNHNDWLGHAVRYHVIADFVNKHVKNVNSILDVGCGNMNLLRFMWRNRTLFTGSYTGLDLRASPKWLEDLNWEKGDIRLVQMDIVKDPAEFVYRADVTVSTEVLEHVPRSMAQILIDRIYSWTEPGGWFFLSSPNAGVSDSTAENHIGPEGSREWTYAEKVRMAELAGFKFKWARGSFIQIKKIPAETLASPLVQRLKAVTPYAWFSVLMAGPFPEQSNNALMVFQKEE